MHGSVSFVTDGQHSVHVVSPQGWQLNFTPPEGAHCVMFHDGVVYLDGKELTQEKIKLTLPRGGTIKDFNPFDR